MFVLLTFTVTTSLKATLVLVVVVMKSNSYL